jgi:hypothetical protein|tara:strand:+ start:133 stop:309 length:177 start_codon:yes stop_codon:yes gene_type:complete
MESKQEATKGNTSWGAKPEPVKVDTADADAATRANIINKCNWAISKGRSLRSDKPLGP